jgi:hypothetical protein
MLSTEIRSAYKGVRGQLTVDAAGDKPAEFTFELSR